MIVLLNADMADVAVVSSLGYDVPALKTKNLQHFLIFISKQLHLIFTLWLIGPFEESQVEDHHRGNKNSLDVDGVPLFEHKVQIEYCVVDD